MPARTLPFLLALILLTLNVLSQNHVRINDVSAIVLRPELAQDKTAQAGMQAAGLSTELIGQVTVLSEPALWPAGLATDSARQANQAALGNYAVNRLCEYNTEEGLMSIVVVPVADNYHMSEELHSKTDLYFVMRSSGLVTVEPQVIQSPPSQGPGWERMPKAKILLPDEVYATYDLSRDTVALAEFVRKGFSQPEIDAVIFRSHERNWPEGMDLFDERYPNLSEFKRYKAYAAAAWDGKVLLVIPAEQNKKAKVGLRPYLDIYMVYAAKAVSVKEVRKKR